MKAIPLFILLFAPTIPLSGAFVYQVDLIPDAVVVEPGDPDPSLTSLASGWAEFTYLPASGELSYEIILENLVFSTMNPRPTLTGPLDLVRAVHLHFGPVGENGPHALNIYGFPREDDGDLFVDPSLRRITGIWSNEDENLGPDNVRGPGDSVAFGDAVAALQSGELYLQVHTMQFRPGELRGQLLLIPEPNIASFFLLGLFVLLQKRRR